MSEDVEIFLSDKAFIGIVISSIEVYKKECLGILLGVKTKDQIIVEHAIPFQAVSKRTFTEVKPNWRKNLKVNEIIPQIVHLEKLGYFHSHPQFGENRRTPSLSKCDKESIEETEIEIVAAINEAKRENWWRESRKELHGTLDYYNIKIAGYIKNKDGRIKKHKLVCPYAVGFDQAFRERG